jgi:hypothetical protein
LTINKDGGCMDEKGGDKEIWTRQWKITANTTTKYTCRRQAARQ